MRTLLKSIAFYTLMLTAAIAANSPGAVVGPLPIANVAAITGPSGHWGPSAPLLNVCGWSACGDGGQGIFAYQSTSCASYGPYCIHDADGNYYLRTNINGTVQQVGVTLGSAYDWQSHIGTASDITPVLNSMGTGLAAAGLSTINTNGVSVQMKTSYDVPAGMFFTCNITPGVPQTGWYNSVPGAVYKSHGVVFDTAGNASNRSHCFILPDSLTTKPTNAQTQKAQNDGILTAGDTGLNCSNEACNDHDLWILGFDTGYDAQDAADSVLENVIVDANVCFRMRSTGVAPRWHSTQCTPFLNRNIPNNEEHFDITKIESGAGGVCHVTVVPAAGDSQAGILADLPYAPYMYMTNLAGAANVCGNQYGGLWKINNIDTGAGTFDLIGSAVAGPTAQCHWDSGTYIIYCSDLTNISNGEVINGMDAQGIPTGTEVSVPWPLPPNENGTISDTGGAANTYVAVGSANLQNCQLGDGANVIFTAAHSNTGASTLEATLYPASATNSCTGGTTGAIAIVREDGSALQANDIVAGKYQVFRYSGTLSKWVLMQAKVILDTKTTTAQSAPIATTFNGATCTGHTGGAGGCGPGSQALFLFTARVDAGSSSAGVAAGGLGWATCMLIGGPTPQDHDDNDKVGGFQVDQSGCFDHTVEWHIENTNETGLTNFASDSHGNDDDPNPIMFLVDGQVNNCHLIGRKASKGGRSIVINNVYKNNPDRGSCAWIGASVASTTGFLPVADVEQGSFIMLAGDTNSAGVNLVSNFASAVRFDTAQPNVTNWYEGSTARSVSDTTGSFLVAGQNYPWAGAGLQTNTTTDQAEATGGKEKEITGAATNILTNNDCGGFLNGYTGGVGVVTLQSSPPSGCEITFKPNLTNILVNFNGKVANLDGFGAHDISYLLIPFKKPENGFLSIVYDGTIWRSGSRSSVLYQNVNPLSVPQLFHGQVRFDYDGSQYLTLTNKNGPGGIIVDQQMHQVSSSGLKFDKAGTTSSTLNYFYVANQIDTITGAASDAGAIKLTLTTALTGANVGDQVRLDCFSMTNTEANGFWDGTVTTDTSHVDLIGSTFVSTGTGICRVDWMMASTTGHAASTNGVETNSGTVNGFGAGAVTFVGEANVGGSHAVNDSAADREVASWFNRKLKTCKNVYTTTRTTTSTSYADVNSEIHCPFITFGDADLRWSINGMMNNTTALDGEAATAGFDGTSAETEQVASAAGATQQMPLSVNGSKSGLSEGAHYITLLGKAITGGTAQYFGTTPVTSVNISIPQ